MFTGCDGRGFWKPLSSHPVSTVYCAYNNEVINYHSAEDNTNTGYWKTEKENIKILLMKYSLKKIQAIVKKKIIIDNRKNKLVGKALWKENTIYVGTLSKVYHWCIQWGGFQGRGGASPFFSENLLKLCENYRKWDWVPFFYSGTRF